jgi:hypothetical protein
MVSNDRTFEEWWKIYKEEIEQNERNALEQPLTPDNPSIIKVLCGTDTFAANNFCPFHYIFLTLRMLCSTTANPDRFLI